LNVGLLRSPIATPTPAGSRRRSKTSIAGRVHDVVAEIDDGSCLDPEHGIEPVGHGAVARRSADEPSRHAIRLQRRVQLDGVLVMVAMLMNAQ
jgi:hypothetical protein